MSWMEDRSREVKELERRTQEIAAEAPKLYESLWEEIAANVKEAQTKKLLPLEPLTNGSGHDRIVRIPVPPQRQETLAAPKELHIRLSKDKQTIVASGHGVNVKLDLDICDDGIVCLKSAGQRISIQQAVILLLDQFFFPQLAKE